MAGPVIEEEDLESTVLTFWGASFGFERTVKVGSLDLALFLSLIHI